MLLLLLGVIISSCSGKESPTAPATGGAAGSATLTMRWRDAGCETRPWAYVDVSVLCDDGCGALTGWSNPTQRLKNDRNASVDWSQLPNGQYEFVALMPTGGVFLHDKFTLSGDRTITFYCTN